MKVQNHNPLPMEAQLQKFAEVRELARKRMIDKTPQQKLSELINIKQQTVREEIPAADVTQTPAPLKPAADNSGLVSTTLKKANELLLYNQDSKTTAKNTDPQTRGNYVDLVA